MTFPLTDTEGSMALWDGLGETFRSAFQEHHALLCAEFRRHRGHETKEAGDTFIVAFAGAGDAVACAVACQRALAGATWPVEVGPPAARLAIHAGDVMLEDGEYQGVVLHRASRVLTAAHGGQIICSEAVATLLRRDLPPGVRLVDLGPWRLRDVSSPERVFQVEHSDLPQHEFPVGSHNQPAHALRPRIQGFLPLDAVDLQGDPLRMFWHTMLLLLSPLAALIGRLTPDDRDREILALRQQVLILQRQLGKRPRLVRAKRLAFLLTCLRMEKQQLLNALLIVKPATVVGWHKQIVRRHRTLKQKQKPGRPPIDPEAEQLVLRIARENLRWGYTKIAGEARKLGYPTIGRSTVERLLKRHGLAPRPHHAGLSWADFPGALRSLHLGLRPLDRDHSNAAHLLSGRLH